MPLRDDFLTPIAGDNPAGVDLRDDNLWDVIKEARRWDPVPEDGRPPKTADWAAVVRDTTEAIATRSKDLQLAIWLIEAMFYRESFAGMAQAVRATAEMLVKFWDHLYPPLEDGDAGFRISLLEFFNRSDRPLYAAIRLTPVTQSGVTIYQFRESEDVGVEKPDDDYDKRQARKKKTDAGKMSGEQFADAFKATPKAWYKQRAAEIASALAAIDALDKAGNEVFGRDAPGYNEFRKPITEVQGIIGQLLREKLVLEPDPVELTPEPAATDGALGNGATPAGDAAVPGGLTPEPTSRDDATQRIVVAARWLRQAEPTSPTSYLMLRALRWGELRAQAPEPDLTLLDAPLPTSRKQLRALSLSSKWPELLETAETVMATPAGRGWLDLQRYVLLAADGLGGTYAAVGTAIRSELRALLREIPSLVDKEMMDGLPTASPETRNWLRAEFAGAQADDVAIAAEAESAAGPIVPAVGSNGRDPAYERALGEVRAGRSQKAIELLLRELDREKSARGRFLRQAQVTHIMVESGFEAIARPILDEMLQRMETHRLEEWESGPLLAQPLSALYKCLAKTGEDTSRQQQLYLRICRLDPVQAMSFGPKS